MDFFPGLGVVCEILFWSIKLVHAVFRFAPFPCVTWDCRANAVHPFHVMTVPLTPILCGSNIWSVRQPDLIGGCRRKVLINKIRHNRPRMVGMSG